MPSHQVVNPHSTNGAGVRLRCTGNIEIHPLVFIVIDWGIVAWLVSGGFGSIRSPAQAIEALRLELTTWWEGESSIARQRWIGAGVFVFGLGLLQFPFAQPIWNAFLGKPAIVALVTIDGELHLNQEQTRSVTITNRSNQPARVVGMDRSCRCFELVEDPIQLLIPAQQEVTLPLLIKPNKPGPIQQRIVLFLEHSEQFRVPINLFSFSQGEK